jgi:hypothetical protein
MRIPYKCRHVRLVYQPPTSNIFLSEQISHQSAVLFSQKIIISNQPPAKRTGNDQNFKLNLAILFYFIC